MTSSLTMQKFLHIKTQLPRMNWFIDILITGQGVAAQADTSRMSFGTVFKYLKTVKDMTITAEWLTPTLVVLLYIHEGNYLSFRAHDGDTCVHAVVRYAVITGMHEEGMREGELHTC